MDNLDKLKKQWNKTTIKRDERERDLIDRTVNRRLTSTRERIAMSQCVIVAVCLVAPALIPLCRVTGGIDFPRWFGLVYTLFFIVMAAFQCVLYYVLSNIDFMKLSVKEAVNALVKYRRLKMRLKFVSVALGAVTIGLMFYAMGDMFSVEVIAGAWVGLVIGGAIGLMLDRRDRRLISRMLDDLSE